MPQISNHVAATNAFNYAQLTTRYKTVNKNCPTYLRALKEHQAINNEIKFYADEPIRQFGGTVSVNLHNAASTQESVVLAEIPYDAFIFQGKEETTEGPQGPTVIFCTQDNSFLPSPYNGPAYQSTAQCNKAHYPKPETLKFMNAFSMDGLFNHTSSQLEADASQMYIETFQNTRIPETLKRNIFEKKLSQLNHFWQYLKGYTGS